MSPTTVAGASGSTDDQDFAPVFDVARAAVAQQFQISERLDNKARGIVTIAAAWFALVQAVANNAFTIPGLDEWWKHSIVIAAGVGALMLICTAVCCAFVWNLRVDTEIAPEGLVEMHTDARRGGDLREKLLLHYAVVLRDRHAQNQKRVTWYKRGQVFWYLAMLAPLVELGFAFAAHAFG